MDCQPNRRGVADSACSLCCSSRSWNLWARHTEEFSLPGFIVTLLAIPVMQYLAHEKIKLANQLGSRALRADAMESVTCGWLSVVAVVSLSAQAASGVWWIDSVGSLAIVWLLVKEGREAWRGECCADYQSGSMPRAREMTRSDYRV
jgi:divalent metal cation (Fe/Co/Zn/Cd) transporter